MLEALPRPDRPALRAALARAGGPRVLVLADVDGFAALNATAGEEAGDEVLVTLMSRIAEATGSRALRIGADELAVLLPPGTDGRAAADLVRGAGAAPIPAGGSWHTVTLSVGWARGTAGDVLLHEAGLALDRVRRGPEGQGCDATVDLLERALLEDRFELHHQPIVDLRTHTLRSTEALLRLRDDDGLVPPGVFLPCAEASGLITAIGAWALRRALLDLAGLRDRLGRAAPASVAVNMSALQLADDGLVEDVARALCEARLPARALTVELTETVLVDGVGPALGVLEALHHLGVGIAIDDFGTGYSALSYLRSVPATVLKLDRRFVADLEDDPHPPVTAAIVELGRALGLPIVAEGVETVLQRDRAASLGCRYAQGFLLGRPVPVDDLEATQVAA